MKKGHGSHYQKGPPPGSGLGPIIFNIFNNDIFYFIEKCDFIKHADDDTLSNFQVQLML